MNQSHRNARRKLAPGFTLIEIILVLSLVGALLAGTISLMTIARESTKQAKDHWLSRSEIRRFADDVRRDVAVAEELTLDGETMSLSSDMPSTKITYRIEPGQIQRTMRTATETTASQESNDRYLVGPNIDVQIELLEDDRIVQWTLTQIERPEEPLTILAARRRAQ